MADPCCLQSQPLSPSLSGSSVWRWREGGDVEGAWPYLGEVYSRETKQGREKKGRGGREGQMSSKGMKERERQWKKQYER